MLFNILYYDKPRIYSKKLPTFLHMMKNFAYFLGIMILIFFRSKYENMSQTKRNRKWTLNIGFKYYKKEILDSHPYYYGFLFYNLDI
ncbi:MAG: hypothetical protein FWH29_04010 [Methanobrevibacter sp.]|nr:hypothetical protein [Methanobrevibacter sp.]